MRPTKARAPSLKRPTVVVFIMAFVFSLVSSVAIQTPQKASALSGSQFNPGRIIDDSVFYNKNAMSASQIQSFLNSKLTNCDTNGSKSYTYRYRASPLRLNDSRDPYVTTTRAVYGQRVYQRDGSAWRGSRAPYTCLKDYRQTTVNIAPESGLCNGYTGASNETAAQMLYKIAQSCGINPQVMIVLLQKEQSLITDDWPWELQYKKATGVSCPDNPPSSWAPYNCDPDYLGFFKQMYYGAHRFKLYKANATNYQYRAGRNNTILWHPNTSCGTSNVYIQNQATAALYIYTPYRPNQAALNNLYGEGNSCSSYGNRNFWRMFNDWFGSTTRSVLFKLGNDNTYYLEWGDNYYPIPSVEILKAYGLAGIAPRILGSFPAGKTIGPTLERSAKFGSDNPDSEQYTAQVDVVDGGKRHAAPNWATLNAHGIGSYTNYDVSLAYLLGGGDPLRTVVRKPSGGIYALAGNKKRIFPDYETYSTLSGPNGFGTNQVYSAQMLTNMSDAYIDNKADGAPMLLDGKLFAVSGSPAIYLFDGGQKHMFSAATYANWGRKLDYTFSQDSVNQIASGYAAPILIKSSAGTKYLANNGKKKAFDISTQSGWGLTDSAFTQLTNRAINRLSLDGNVSRLVKDSAPTVYFVDGGKINGIPSSADFNGLGFSSSDVSALSTQALQLLPYNTQLYAPGSLVRTPNGAVYVIDSNFTSHSVTSGDQFTRFGFSWSKVRNVSNTGTYGYTASPLRTLLKDSGSAKYYVIQGGYAHFVDSAAMSVSQYNFSSLPFSNSHPRFISSLKQGKPLTRFLKGSSQTVYYIENGYRRPISSPSALYTAGGTWSDVVNVTDTFLSEIPVGTTLN